MLPLMPFVYAAIIAICRVLLCYAYILVYCRRHCFHFMPPRAPVRRSMLVTRLLMPLCRHADAAYFSRYAISPCCFHFAVYALPMPLATPPAPCHLPRDTRREEDGKSRGG